MGDKDERIIYNLLESRQSFPRFSADREFRFGIYFQGEWSPILDPIDNQDSLVDKAIIQLKGRVQYG